jgi:hemerythrin superfamily protein
MGKPVADIASKGMGKVKNVQARVKGLKGIFAKLAEEHGEATALMKRIAGSSDPQTIDDLFSKLRVELLTHEHGEMSELYSLLKDHEATRTIAEHHNEEAMEMESLLERLDELEIDTDEWKSTFDQLVEAVSHHAEEEETEIFPKAQDTLGDDTAKSLEEVYSAKKQALEERFA